VTAGIGALVALTPLLPTVKVPLLGSMTVGYRGVGVVAGVLGVLILALGLVHALRGVPRVRVWLFVAAAAVVGSFAYVVITVQSAVDDMQAELTAEGDLLGIGEALAGSMSVGIGVVALGVLAVALLILGLVARTPADETGTMVSTQEPASE
jgi:hypothetical protein